MGEWINAAEAAQRLGVKPSTLYAYVSRGMLARRRGDDGRSSLFEADEVAWLVERGQRGQPRRPGTQARSPAGHLAGMTDLPRQLQQ
jgi:citrate synthase